MGKRSDFERIERDLYITPPEALAPLLPFLAPGTRFLEPCAAGGELAALLEAEGHVCVDAWDIEPLAPHVGFRDALEPLDYNLGAVDVIISNTPWRRDLLHRMIVNFSDRRPTWLLFDADWIQTTQETIAKKHGVPTVPELFARCRRIVPVGRVKWIPGSKHAGKDNCAWYEFGAPIPGTFPIVCPPTSRRRPAKVP